MERSDDIVRVAQLSDTHFVEHGASAEGGFAYDTALAFDAVHTHLESGPDMDLITVTGDIADHGRAAQYEQAASAFSRFTAPVNVCPGNHDQDVAFTAGMGRPGVGTSRALQAGPWAFLFVDSNAGVMTPNDAGRFVDPEAYEDRLHGNGSLAVHEASWVQDMCSTVDAEHVFIWLHHPPAVPVPLTSNPGYAADWQELLAKLRNVRGMAGGHTHVPDDYIFEGRPVFVSPALKNNFDLQANTLLPPGYRTFEFLPDGSVTSEVQLVDDPQWPRNPLGRAVVALFNGELTYAELDEIIARKQAERAGTQVAT